MRIVPLAIFDAILKLSALGHRALWKGGLHHRDISANNLTYFNCGKTVNGVLNDYDLATLANEKRKFARERTGTMPFMALDLLTDEAWNSKVDHIYGASIYAVGYTYANLRILIKFYDVESFAWVLVWIASRYNGGKLALKDQYKNWAGPSYESNYDAKRMSFNEAAVTTTSHSGHHDVVVAVLEQLYKIDIS